MSFFVYKKYVFGKGAQIVRLQIVGYELLNPCKLDVFSKWLKRNKIHNISFYSNFI